METYEIVFASISFVLIVVLYLMLLHEKGKTNALKRIANFHGLEQEIGEVVITKFTAEKLQKDHRLVMCSGIKHGNPYCRSCLHSTPHEHTADCMSCETVVRVHIPTPSYTLKKDLNS